jgi:competence protein ComEC
MRRTIQIIVLAIGFLIGVTYSAHFLIQPNLILLLAAYSVLALLVVCSKYGYVLLAIIGLSLGIWRGDLYFNQSEQYSYTNFVGQKVVAVGTVTAQPSWDQQGEYTFELGSVSINGKHFDHNIRIKSLTGLAKQGNRVQVSGKLWPTLGKTEVGIRYAKVEIINPSQPFEVRAKEWLLTEVGGTMPKPSSDFMIGVLIGERSSLPRDMQDMLTVLGLSHVIAVSGYNLSILAGMLDRVLNGRWRWGGLALSLWAVWGFVLLTGAGASIMRAGIMTTIFLVLRYYGKDRAVLPALGLCAVIMVAINPSYLHSNLSWQLSFLSLVGIVVLAPRIQMILPPRPKLLMELLAVTLAAQLATLGLVAYKFGQISLIAPLANLIVMPLIPPLMMAGMGLVVLHLLVPGASIVMGAWLAYGITTLFDLLHYISSWQVSQVNIIQPSLWQITIYYSVLLVWIGLTTRNPRLKLFQNDPKNAIISPINDINLNGGAIPSSSKERGGSEQRAKAYETVR